MVHDRYMITVKTRDIVKKSSLLGLNEPVLVINGNNRQPKSVIISYSLYEKVQDIIESELFMARNSNFVESATVHKEFLEKESAILEDIYD